MAALETKKPETFQPEAGGEACDSECLPLLNLSPIYIHTPFQDILDESLDLWNHALWDEIWSAACTEDSELHTPPSKLIGQVMKTNDHDTTPDPIPKPFAKIQLQAAKKLELRLASNTVKEKKANDKRKQDSQQQAEPAEPAKPAAPAMPADKGAPTKTEQTKPKTKRKPANGPMGEAMKAFMEAKKAANIPYKEALQLWGKSSEREAIVANMSDSERKRRRF